jgi:hypothetical protein
MIPKIANRYCLPVVCIVAVMLIFLNAPTQCHGFEIAIDVAPNTLNIESEGTVVTVHTDIPYSAVDGYTVTLNEIAIQSYKSDNRGYFVAKFSMMAVEALINEEILELGEITLMLEGKTTYGELFAGSQVITVINIIPEGAGGN